MLYDSNQIQHLLRNFTRIAVEPLNTDYSN